MFIKTPLTTVFLLTIISQTVLAKPQSYVLTDPQTDAPLAHTPYFMSVKKEKLQASPQYTDANGRTRVSAQKPEILVQAEGSGKQIFMTNLNLTEDQPKAIKGVPYIIYNQINNLPLCGYINAEGFTHAYFVDNAKSWYDNSFIFQLQPKQSCFGARDALKPLFDPNSSSFVQTYEALPKAIVISDERKKLFLFDQINRLIKDKNIDIKSKSAKETIDYGIQTAIADQDDKRLNSIGYTLGFERQDYKRGLLVLDEALKIKPNDCYSSNSKGYLLMRSGDLKASRQYFYEADKACFAEAAEHKNDKNANKYNYPIAVNYAHLAENYALSGDEYLANDFFSRSVRLGSTLAKTELIEVATHLNDKQVLSKENLALFSVYLQYVQREAEKSGQK